VLGARLTNTAFDEYAHAADVRRGRGATGWHDIPRLGVFLWRLRSFHMRQVTPVAVKPPPNAPCQQYTFDPTGRDIPLFAGSRPPPGDHWVPPLPDDVPGPISPALLRADLSVSPPTAPKLYANSLALYRESVPSYEPIPVQELASDPRSPGGKPWIDPVNGRMVWPVRPDKLLRVDYHYGFAAQIGAGPYERPAIDLATAAQSPVTTTVDPQNPVTIPSTGSLVIANSLTYASVSAPAEIRQAVVRAGDQERPLLRLGAGATLTLRGASQDATLLLDGVFISGGADIVLDGSFHRVTLSCCTLDPGTWDGNASRFASAADERSLAPTCLRIAGSVHELVIDRCICGPILVGSGAVGCERLSITESIVQAADPATLALDVPSGDVVLSKSTLLGRAEVHHIDASECILHERVRARDIQRGCVRFSAYAERDAESESRLPRKYQSVPIASRSALFGSHAFGNPAYAQLLASAGAAIAEGAEDGSEMGAFWRERCAVKERSLLIKYREYLPLGLEPVVIFVT
jgi:hypothetical protein